MTTPVIILIEPQLGENIGMVARAMGNFAVSQLRLVNPKEPWPNEKAKRAAVGADVILDHVQIYNSFPEAIGDLEHVYATTAMPRYMVKPKYALPDVFAKIAIAPQKAGLVFGPERTGLTNEQITLCHGIIQLPTNPEFSSLNLAQAVLLCVYEWYKFSPSYTVPDLEAPTLAKREDVQFFLETLEAELDKTGFLRPVHKRPLMVQNLRNIFTRMSLTEQEVRTLRGALKALVHGKD